tara:strand:- start:293 stop:472 length:180 start_codon:yes stop_codon:yes gene_type:complete
MGKRAKYKVGDRLEFQFAGAPHKGKVLEVDRCGKEIKYTCKDGNGFFYPFSQEDVIRKL